MATTPVMRETPASVLRPVRSSSAQASALRWSGRAVGTPLDMIIDGLYRKNACYIVGEMWSESEQDWVIREQGTAFFVSVRAGYAASAYYAVTAGHVVARDPKIRGIFFRINLLAGGFQDVPSVYEDWALDPDSDVAVCRLTLPPAFEVFAFPMHESYGPFNPQPGHDVFFVGLFQNLPGENSVGAMVRFGKVCLPETTMSIWIDGDTSISTNAFLIQATIWGGESGSPVYMYDDYHFMPGEEQEMVRIAYDDGFSDPAYDSSRFGPQLKSKQVAATDVKPNLVGVVQGRFLVQDPVITDGKETDSVANISTGITAVIPIARITRLLMLPQFIREREEMSERAKKARRLASTPKPASTSGQQPN
jgi:hypothetical protein